VGLSSGNFNVFSVLNQVTTERGGERRIYTGLFITIAGIDPDDIGGRGMFSRFPRTAAVSITGGVGVGGIFAVLSFWVAIV
jgi:hypothetical protein